ncbi:hypothetical protein GCM10007063_34740 [Lentibacillus kapialis]|uniref:Uncharacterized protein n=1 Tax=Lentibacillus kapialis TaxID=340214 RepID=A0A917Q303_9BACI|nr:hypothetical protein [Lentibacillus kapialis]GGK09336.1 hypothetical protein GCM10007063_34740 [Lentibacillus kapialis]
MIKENSIWHGIGLGIFLSIVVSTLLGWAGLGNDPLSSFILYLLCYIPVGLLVAHLNPYHPYTLAAISGVILTVLNQIVTIFYFSPGILAYPFILRSGILFGIIACLIGAAISTNLWRLAIKVKG